MTKNQLGLVLFDEEHTITANGIMESIDPDRDSAISELLDYIETLDGTPPEEHGQKLKGYVQQIEINSCRYAYQLGFSRAIDVFKLLLEKEGAI